MKCLPILVLLSSAVQLYAAVSPLKPVTCDEDGSTDAVRLAMHHINEHHEHGYKFSLSSTTSEHKVEKVDEGCNIVLKLNIEETKCHTVNPQHFEDCQSRELDRASATCDTVITVRNAEAKVTSYQCDTQLVSVGAICPDCPTLLPLNNSNGLKAVEEAVKKFNSDTNNSNLHYYKLQEVGRMTSGYMMIGGMVDYAEIALVETNCPKGSRIAPEACTPLCPDRARHALCQSTYFNRDQNVTRLECEHYPPKDTTALSPGEQEPVCGEEPHPHCGAAGLRIHPICPWPRPELQQTLSVQL